MSNNEQESNGHYMYSTILNKLFLTRNRDEIIFDHPNDSDYDIIGFNRYDF